MDPAALDELTRDEMRDVLRDLDLPVSGLKAELRDRLAGHLEQQHRDGGEQPDQGADGAPESGSDDLDAAPGDGATVLRRVAEAVRTPAQLARDALATVQERLAAAGEALEEVRERHTPSDHAGTDADDVRPDDDAPDDGTLDEADADAGEDEDEDGDGAGEADDVRAITAAIEQGLRTLQATGIAIDGVVDVSEREDGYVATVWVVEAARRPETMDLLACYEVAIGEDASVLDMRLLQRSLRHERDAG